MKIDHGTDEVFDDRTARFDHDDPADRARLAAFDPPPTTSEQLAMLAELVDAADLDQHDADDLRQALRLVELYNKQIGVWLDREDGRDKLRERVNALAEQLIAAATQLGAAHQRAFDRAPLSVEIKSKPGRSKAGRESGRTRGKAKPIYAHYWSDAEAPGKKPCKTAQDARTRLIHDYNRIRAGEAPERAPRELHDLIKDKPQWVPPKWQAIYNSVRKS